MTFSEPSFRQRRAHRTRQRILDAGLRLFSDRGYDGASMDDIALELEATKGLLYHYFDSKQELLTAILQEHPLRASIESMGEVTAPSLREALAIASREGLRVMRKNHAFVRFLLLQAQSSREQAEIIFREIVDKWTAAYQATIERHTPGQQPVPSVLASQLVDIILSSFIRNELADALIDDLDDYMEEAVETITNRINADQQKAQNAGGQNYG